MHRQRIGHRPNVVTRQMTGDLKRRRPAVEQNHVPVVDQIRRRPANGPLLRSSRLLPLGIIQRAVPIADEHGTSVSAANQSFLLQHAQIPTDG